MRILYHHRTASKDGQAVHIDEMVGALRSLGHEVRVVGPGGDTEQMGASIGWVGRLKSGLPRALYELLELAYSIVAFARIARVVREFKPDLIYERYNLFLLAGLISKRWFGLPVVLEVNAPLAHERSGGEGLSLARLATWAEQTAWRGADRVLPVSQALAAYVTARGVPKERLVVISNGVNEAHFGKAISPALAKAQLGLSDKLVLGFAGFVRDWHGVDRIIRWMAGPEVAQHTHLLVVGDGPARAHLESLAHDCRLGDRVTFTGVVSRRCVPDYVAAFDIALQPAVVPYASPLKLFEYLCLGKAIVAPRQSNVEEILTHEENAILFDPDAADGLPTALQRVVGNGELRNRLAAEAARTIRKRQLTWLDCARRVAVVCADVVRDAHDKAELRCPSVD
jgi:glycosyltransferase involved in cell wall biosynthesis